MECQYCRVYESARLREERNKEQYRHCRELGKWVIINDKWCPEFELTHYFFCDKTSHRLSYDVCIARQRKEECKCKQGRIIKEMRKGLSQGKRRRAAKTESKLIKRR